MQDLLERGTFSLRVQRKHVRYHNLEYMQRQMAFVSLCVCLSVSLSLCRSVSSSIVTGAFPSVGKRLALHQFIKLKLKMTSIITGQYLLFRLLLKLSREWYILSYMNISR